MAIERNTARIEARPSARHQWRPRHNRWAIAGTVTIATFMEVLDGSVANIALPHIASGLSITREMTTWILTAYLVSSAIVLPMSGWLAARIGRKRYYMSSVAWFTVSSLLCGIAPNLWALIIFRVMQGAGGGGLGPSEQSILADNFSGTGKSLAFAAYGIVIVLAPTVGPTLGGYLTDTYGWRWVFFINVPIGIFSFFLSYHMLEDPPHIKRERARKVKIDYLGVGLLAVALGSLQVVLDRGQRFDWFQSGVIVALAALSGTALIAVAIWEWFQKYPVIDLHLYTCRNFALSSLMMFALAAILYGTLLSIPEFVQSLLNYTAEQAGEILWPSALAIIPLLLMVGWMLPKIDARYLIAAGFILTALATFHIARKLDLSISSMDATMFQVYQSIGLSFLFVPLTTISYRGIPADRNDEISSLLNFARNIGGSVGISFVTTELVRRTQQHQSVLAAQASSYNPELKDYLLNHYSVFSKSGASSAQALEMAAGGLYKTVVEQAMVLSYVDIFWIFGMVALAMAPLVILMKKPSRREASAVGF
jgi:DHA2 family multidrug resistance protein